MGNEFSLPLGKDFSPWFLAIWYDTPECTFFFLILFGVCLSFLNLWFSVCWSLKIFNSHYFRYFFFPITPVPHAAGPFLFVFCWLLSLGRTYTFPSFLHGKRKMVVLCPLRSNPLLRCQGLWPACVHFLKVSNYLGEAVGISGNRVPPIFGLLLSASELSFSICWWIMMSMCVLRLKT